MGVVSSILVVFKVGKLDEIIREVSVVRGGDLGIGFWYITMMIRRGGD